MVWCQYICSLHQENRLPNSSHDTSWSGWPPHHSLPFGFAVLIIMLPMPSHGTMTEPITNYLKSSAHTAPLSLISASYTAFCSCSATKWDRLMADLAELWWLPIKQQSVETHSTTKPKGWNRYTKYCKSIRHSNNLFLKGMSRWLCIKDDFQDHAMLPWLKS